MSGKQSSLKERVFRDAVLDMSMRTRGSSAEGSSAIDFCEGDVDKAAKLMGIDLDALMESASLEQK